MHLELDQTELAIAGATGYTTDLLRPPYSSGVEAIDSADWQALRQARNFRAVFTDLDTKDWTRPGVGRIVASAVPSDGQGAVVMMHDGGGDRSQTVAALDKVIVDLQHRGYTFDTVSPAIGAASPWHPASFSQRLRGHLLIAAVRLSERVVHILRIAFLGLAGLAVLRTLLLLVLARRHARSSRTAHQPPGTLPPVSVVVPAYNEELGIAAAVQSLARQRLSRPRHRRGR